MKDPNLLDYIKKSLPIYDDFHDEMLYAKIDEVKDFMLDAGVPENLINDPKTYGCIFRGVSDLWNNGKISDFFKMRLVQLKK